MSIISDFVVELIRATNQVHLVTPFERRRLIARGLGTIADLRHSLDERGVVTTMSSRILKEVATLLDEPDDTPAEIFGVALMVLADEINKLSKLAAP
ncbi:hypothetical protein A6U87_16550 [Rhizobium sp. AC44/96]|uniref:hypothetical protein n=1 Tax=Rhizobium sp. AC44/96 TaxID=1841654 RepID=UPI00080FC994|nr:hypothetical protein [Rhizobium sp. AC44/96]OCJ04441.1 hypothetical protein A6U87_16550 [Rhizobium sp. AC44/96]